MGKHLTWNDRLTIERMLLDGSSKQAIANAVGCCVRTIYYEVKRARYTHLNHRTWIQEDRYNPDGAQKKYDAMLATKGATAKVLLDDEYRKAIADLILNKDYSPQAAMFKVNKDGCKYKVRVTSANTIYRAIRQGYIEGVTMKHCPLHGKKKVKKEKVRRVQKRPSKGTSIEKRDKEVRTRETFGHWEMDSVVGKKESRPALLVMTERKTRFEIIEPLANHGAMEVVRALNRLQSHYGSNWGIIFKSITCDNGSEFMDNKSIEQMTDLYYAHPNAPFERGSNEVNNRFVRRKHPKGTVLNLTQEDADELQDCRNSYLQG